MCISRLYAAPQDSAFGISDAFSLEYNYFRTTAGYDSTAYWNWADNHFQVIGAHWTRSLQHLNWDMIQPVIGGAYRWTNEVNTDGVITRIYQSPNQINWVGTFDGGTFNALQRNPLSYQTSYSKFVKDVVERYDGDGGNDASAKVKVKYWQPGNEMFYWTNTGRSVNDYITYYRLTRSAALSADSGAKFILIATTHSEATESFLVTLIDQLGPAKEFDVIDIHHWDVAQQYKIPILPILKQKLHSMGLDSVQIWSLENGTYAGNPTGLPVQSEDDQARALVKCYTWNRANGLDKLFWNNLVDFDAFGGATGSLFNSIGLISDGLNSGDSSSRFNTPRTAYWNDRALAAKTDYDYASYYGTVTGLHDELGIYAYAYTRRSDNHRLFVMWREFGTSIVNFNVPDAKYHVTKMLPDRFGNFTSQIDVTTVSGKLTLTLGIDPLLVEPILPTMVPDAWLKYQ